MKWNRIEWTNKKTERRKLTMMERGREKSIFLYVLDINPNEMNSLIRCYASFAKYLTRFSVQPFVQCARAAMETSVPTVFNLYSSPLFRFPRTFAVTAKAIKKIINICNFRYHWLAHQLQGIQQLYGISHYKLNCPHIWNCAQLSVFALRLA